MVLQLCTWSRMVNFSAGRGALCPANCWVMKSVRLGDVSSKGCKTIKVSKELKNIGVALV